MLSGRQYYSVIFFHKQLIAARCLTITEKLQFIQNISKITNNTIMKIQILKFDINYKLIRNGRNYMESYFNLRKGSAFIIWSSKLVRNSSGSFSSVIRPSTELNLSSMLLNSITLSARTKKFLKHKSEAQCQIHCLTCTCTMLSEVCDSNEQMHRYRPSLSEWIDNAVFENFLHIFIFRDITVSLVSVQDAVKDSCEGIHAK